MHSDLWFALGWGAFPAFTAFWVQAGELRARWTAGRSGLPDVECRAAAAEHAGARASAAHGVGQRRAATDGRRLVKLDAARIAAPMEGALMACAAGVVLLAAASWWRDFSEQPAATVGIAPYGASFAIDVGGRLSIGRTGRRGRDTRQDRSPRTAIGSRQLLAPCAGRAPVRGPTAESCPRPISLALVSCQHLRAHRPARFGRSSQIGRLPLDSLPKALSVAMARFTRAIRWICPPTSTCWCAYPMYFEDQSQLDLDRCSRSASSNLTGSATSGATGTHAGCRTCASTSKPSTSRGPGREK